MNQPPRTRYQLILEALPDEVPAANRLRRLLKFALRGLQFRCIETKEIPGESPPDDKETSEPL